MEERERVRRDHRRQTRKGARRQMSSHKSAKTSGHSFSHKGGNGQRARCLCKPRHVFLYLVLHSDHSECKQAMERGHLVPGFHSIYSSSSANLPYLHEKARKELLADIQADRTCSPLLMSFRRMLNVHRTCVRRNGTILSFS